MSGKWFSLGITALLAISGFLVWIIRRIHSGHSGTEWFIWIVCGSVMAAVLLAYGGDVWYRNVLGTKLFMHRDNKEALHVHLFEPVFESRMDERVYIQFRVGGWFNRVRILPIDPGYNKTRWKISTWDGERFTIHDTCKQSLTGVEWSDLLCYVERSNGGTSPLSSFFVLPKLELEDGEVVQEKRGNRIRSLKEAENDVDALGIELQKVRLLIIWSKVAGFEPLPRDIRERLEKFLGRFFLPKQEEWRREAKRQLEEDRQAGEPPNNPPLAN